MIYDTALDHSSKARRIDDFYNALKLIGEKNINPVRGKSWFDDQCCSDSGPEETQIDESWMDDLDEAA